jgi:hypothetical protein
MEFMDAVAFGPAVDVGGEKRSGVWSTSNHPPRYIPATKLCDPAVSAPHCPVSSNRQYDRGEYDAKTTEQTVIKSSIPQTVVQNV